MDGIIINSLEGAVVVVASNMTLLIIQTGQQMELKLNLVIQNQLQLKKVKDMLKVEGDWDTLLVVQNGILLLNIIML